MSEVVSSGHKNAIEDVLLLHKCSTWPSQVENIHLKAYSQISDRGRSQNCQNLNFLHMFIAFALKTHFPKGIEQKIILG